MQQLNEAIAMVLREVERGFAARRANGGLALTPERIRLSLNFTLDAADGSVRTEPNGPHSVTVEFKVGEAGQWQPVTAPAVPVAGLPAPTEIVPTLTQVFGAPGFDSSARATVFRETLAERSHEEVVAALVALRTTGTPPAEEVVRRASQVLRGIIQSGPTKNVAQGAEKLIALLVQNPLADVLGAAETTWKTHEDWLGIRP